VLCLLYICITTKSKTIKTINHKPAFKIRKLLLKGGGGGTHLSCSHLSGEGGTTCMRFVPTAWVWKQNAERRMSLFEVHTKKKSRSLFYFYPDKDKTWPPKTDTLTK